jgi:diguanylate cyclase (GGDEF)-like protein
MQIAMTFGAIVLVLIFLLSVLLGKLQATTIRENAGTALQVVANNAQRILAVGLQRRLLIVQRLAGSETMWRDGLGSEGVRNAIQQQQMVDANLAWIGVADLDGIVRASTGNLLLGANVAARPWFGAGLKGSHVGDVHEALMLAKLLPPNADGEPQRFVDFAAPIVVDGETRGVLALHGSWDWAKTVIESQLPDDAQSMVMDLFIFERKGHVIYTPHGLDGESAGLHGAFEAITQQKSQTATLLRWPDGHEYLTSVAPLRPKDQASDLGWLVVARAPKDLADAAVNGAILRIAMLGIVAALLAMVAAWFVSGSISKPLSAIQRAAQDVLNGKAGATIPLYSGNVELEGLSSALHNMTEGFETRVLEHTRLARFDSLTKLLNRRGFEEHMEIAVANAKRRGTALSVIAIDIDHFKKVNDEFGHDVGDLVLKNLATVMKTWFRETDIVARLGGEEFTVLLVDTDLHCAQQVAEQLVQHVEATPFPVVGRVTISCGVSKMYVAEEGLSALKRADRALYRAKSDGRNRSVMLDTEIKAGVEAKSMVEV